MKNAIEQITKRIEALKNNVTNMKEEISAKYKTCSAKYMLNGSLSEVAIKEEKFYLIRWLVSGFKELTVEETIEKIKDSIKLLVNDLTGQGFLGGGRGPWRHNSTCPYQNEINIIECDAKREAIAFLRNSLDLLQETK